MDKKEKEIIQKNNSTYYSFNGTQLRELLGKKPEDSLDEFKNNLTVPLVIRGDLKPMSDEKWEGLASDIINNKYVGAELDEVIYNYYNEITDAETHIDEKETKEKHFIHVMENKCFNHIFEISDEALAKLQEGMQEDDTLSASILREVVDKDSKFVSGYEISSEYLEADIEDKKYIIKYKK